jgi:quinol monooxygenase YgiN
MSANDSQHSLIVVHVHVHVKPDAVDAFRAATLANARASIAEPGVARFDVGQSVEDPARFVLVEVYKTPAAPAAHKETPHYQLWRDTVAPMMAEPRAATKFVNVFPANDDW